MTDDEHLKKFRDQINRLDQVIANALGERLAICKNVGHFKKQHGIAMMQPARIDAVKKRCAEMGMAHDLRPEFMHALYDLIIQEACALEDDIIGADA